MGDGLLAEFGSAVNAVECAVALQQGMAAANLGNLPEDRRIVLRIGISLGDVVVEGTDLYGDGVNIAARLEQLAEPGGILVSGVYLRFRPQQGRNRLRGRRPSEFEEHRHAGSCLAGVLDSLHTTGALRPRPSSGKAVDRSAALHQHVRRSGTIILLRRHHRGHHHRVVALPIVAW